MSDPRAIVAVLTGHAAGLSQAYAEMAEAAHAAGDHELGLRYFDAFDRGFRSVRLGFNLDLRLQSPVRAADRGHADGRAEDERPEAPEVERPERFEYTERDRDREAERASFPLLLKTLGGLVADAETLPGPQPAELLTLRELLAQFSPSSCGEGPGVGVLARPPQAGPAKPRLLTSALTPALLPARERGSVGPPRRATGPPKR